MFGISAFSQAPFSSLAGAEVWTEVNAGNENWYRKG